MGFGTVKCKENEGSPPLWEVFPLLCPVLQHQESEELYVTAMSERTFSYSGFCWEISCDSSLLYSCYKPQNKPEESLFNSPIPARLIQGFDSCRHILICCLESPSGALQFGSLCHEIFSPCCVQRLPCCPGSSPGWHPHLTAPPCPARAAQVSESSREEWHVQNTIPRMFSPGIASGTAGFPITLN